MDGVISIQSVRDIISFRDLRTIDSLRVTRCDADIDGGQQRVAKSVPDKESGFAKSFLLARVHLGRSSQPSPAQHGADRWQAGKKSGKKKRGTFGFVLHRIERGEKESVYSSGHYHAQEHPSDE